VCPNPRWAQGPNRVGTNAECEATAGGMADTDRQSAMVGCFESLYRTVIALLHSQAKHVSVAELPSLEHVGQAGHHAWDRVRLAAQEAAWRAPG